MPEKYRDSIPTTLFIFACSMVLGAFSIVIFLQVNNRQELLVNRQNGLVNQAYNRATNCFAATSPTKRTPEYVKDCYNKAEAAAGVTIERYGDAAN